MYLAVSVGIIALATTALLKRAWVHSDGLKLLLARHWSMLTCDNRGITSQGSTSFALDPQDIFVVTFGRSGTMFMVNLLHQLRTGGDESFDDAANLGRFWVPMSGLGREKLSRPQVGAPPRLFFSHGLPNQIPTPNYVIYVQRNPEDILKSWYAFQMQMYGFSTEEIGIEDYYFNCIRKHCVFPVNSLVHNFAEWWIRRRSDNILWLKFEDFLSTSTFELAETVQHFLRPIHKIREQNISEVLDKIDYSFIGKNPEKFDVHTYNDFLDEALAECAPNRANLKVSRNHVGIKTAHELKVNLRVNLTEALRRHLEHAWRLTVLPVTGFRTYQDTLTTGCNFF